MPSKPSDPTDRPSKPDSERRIRQASRVARALRVLNLLQSPIGASIQRIADALECSERTVYRDLTVLELAGIPWFHDRHAGVYRLREDFVFPVLALDSEELRGLGLASGACRAPGLDLSSGKVTATEKIASRLKSPQESLFLDMARHTEWLDLKLADHSRHLDTIRALQMAMARRRMVEVVYHSPHEGRKSHWRLHPYRLCLVKSAWYLLAKPEAAEEVKTLRVQRFRSVQELPNPSVVPGDFDSKKHFGNAWGVYRGSRSHAVNLVFQKAAAEAVSETIWHHTQTIRLLPRGRLRMTFRVDGLEEITRWVLGWAGLVQVEAPIELRERIQEFHRRGMMAQANPSRE